MNSKKIILMRHAQTAELQPGGADFERTLIESGKANAREAGKNISTLFGHPDLIISSAAVRAKATATLVNESLKLPVERFVGSNTLYKASAEDLMHEISALSPEFNTVLLVGHNPAISSLATRLSSREIDLKPCEFVTFEFETQSWSLVETVTARRLTLR